MKHLIKILPKNEAKKLLDELSCGYMLEFCASQKYDVLNGVTWGVMIGIGVNDLKGTNFCKEIEKIVNKLAIDE